MAGRTLNSVWASRLLSACAALVASASVAGMAVCADAPRKPNVVLIMTDDQGYGDLSCLGNPVLKTPQLDALYRDSVRLTDFHVDPTCSPTRSALMTGRYSTRVGVWHTVMGRHMPRAEEQMMPQVFAENGYATAIFGKWHLGDNFPFRPQDRGFEEVLVHGGGGVGQIPDYWGNDYFDDTYFHNGKPQKFTGYCTDVFFREATRFIESHADRPFFVYLPTNAPHAPYRVADEWSEPYASKVGDDEELAKFYGMIANIDDNVGRLRKRLEELGIADNTLLIFLTDNGTARGVTFSDYRGNDGKLVSGYNAGMRGRKGSPYEGGHHVPCFFHWPKGKLTGGRNVDGLAAHVDLLPTLIDLCGLRQMTEVACDGVNLAAPLAGKAPIAADRVLFAHHQEVPDPEKFRFASVMQGRWRLILRNDIEGEMPPVIELFNLADDPGQTRDVSGEHEDVVAQLRRRYESWWKGLSADFDRPAEIVIGDERQNPTRLTCFEWHSSRQWWQTAINRGFAGNGYWTLRVARPGKYEIALRRWPAEADTAIDEAPEGGKAFRVETAQVRIAGQKLQQPVAREAKSVTFEVSLPAGSTRLNTLFLCDDGAARGAYYATVRRIGDK